MQGIKVKIPESIMIPVIKNNQKRIAPETTLNEVEIESGYGVADILFFSLDKKSAEQRKEIALNRLKTLEILQTLSIVSDFQNEEIAITQLYEKLPYSKEYLHEKILPFFKRSRLFSETEDGLLKLVSKYQVAIKETVAIEAKVSNWRRGLYQAYRYRKYADYSYLAIHEKHLAPPVKHIEEFEDANVGLISVNVEMNRTTIFHKPQKESRLSSNIFKMYTNEFLLQRLGFIH